MREGNNKIFKSAEVIIEGNSVKCGNSSIQISNISQIWAGKLPKEELPASWVAGLAVLVILIYYLLNSAVATLAVLVGILYLANRNAKQEKYSGLNLEVNSGRIFCFISEDPDFAEQVLNLITYIIAKNKDSTNYSISFEGSGEIIDNLEIKSKPQSDVITTNELTPPIGLDKNMEQLNSDLQKLYLNYKEKDGINEEILTLIGQTALYVEEYNLQSLKEAFGKFVSLGLINDCNKLGLNLLINEIKKCIF